MSAGLPKPTSGDAAATFLPYGRQVIEDDDIAAVAEALRGDLLTTGPFVARFEERLASIVGATDAVACANGTAALYLAARALGLGPKKTAIVPALTFLATASAPHMTGADIVFADVDPETGLMRASDFEDAMRRAPGGRADAVFPVHFAGQCCDMTAISAIARPHGMAIVEDAAHALGTASREDNGALVPVGANARSDLTIFSFHPVKAIAMGEGGAVTTNDPELLRRLRSARNHGITRNADEYVHPDAAFDTKGEAHPWYYELTEPGFNFRISDINCALGVSQLGKLGRFAKQRLDLVTCYDLLLAPLAPLVRPLKHEVRSLTAWHIYPVRIDFEAAKISRPALMRALAAEGIGTQVHYIPVYRQPYFSARYGAQKLPGAEAFYAQTLTLPLSAAMRASDAERVVGALKRHMRV